MRACRHFVRMPLLAAVVAALVTSCSGSGGRIALVRSTCAPRAGEKVAKGLLRCAEGSIAYVSNDYASGTGVVIDHDGARYVLTNSHVVDPFSSADLTVGGRVYEQVPVLGVDAGADIAVVGPLVGRDLPAPLTVDAGSSVERGDDVYLVGFPGEPGTDAPADLETTISSGIVSRTRHVRTFDQTYIQTDASIAGGQSGGPLFDARGELIGISGLSFAEEFALVLSADDVADARDRILRGEGDDEYPGVPRGPSDDLVTSGLLTVADSGDSQQLFLPGDSGRRTLEFEADRPDGVRITMSTTSSEGYVAVSRNAPALAVALAELIATASGEEPFERAGSQYDETEMAAETSPGVFSVEVPDGDDVYIDVSAPLTTGPVTVAYSSNLPLAPLTRPRTEQPIRVGERLDHVIASNEYAADFLLDLAPGQRVQIRAESPQSDVGMTIIDPGVVMTPLAVLAIDETDGIETVDDSNEGLYGLDAWSTITAGDGGTYRIQVYSNEGLTVLARLSVFDCDDVDCG